MTNDESYIKNCPSCTSFVGPDATRLMQAMVLQSAIGLLQKGIQPTRGYTMKRAMDMAGSVTGKTYKRAQAEQAKVDLKIWCDEMAAALPVIVEG